MGRILKKRLVDPSLVTVVAWVLIGLSAISVLITAFQSVLFFSFFPLSELQQALQENLKVEKATEMASFIVSSLHFVLPAFFVASLALFIGAVGLLRRQGWARMMLIGIFVLGIVWSIAIFVFQQVLIGLLFPSGAALDPRIDAEAMQLVARVASGLVMLVLIGILGGLIRCLLSARVKAEFEPECE